MLVSAGVARALVRLAFGLDLVALLLDAVAAPGTRFGLWHFRIAFLLLLVATIAGVVAFAAGIVAFAGGPRGPAITAALGALVALSLPMGILLRAFSVPALHDVTTDTETPPAFVDVLPRRGAEANPAAYAGREIAEQQRRAYPDVAPMTLADPPAQAFARAEDVARRLGWDIVAAHPAEGRIEATDTTFWFGFKDDVVIRIRPERAGSRVDVRSLSRVGRSDLGKNAARVRAFLGRMRG
jgi:uncharacterized protein (DUF1499 family)